MEDSCERSLAYCVLFVGQADEQGRHAFIVQLAREESLPRALIASSVWIFDIFRLAFSLLGLKRCHNSSLNLQARSSHSINRLLKV